jgi:hypothetical protein
MTRTFLAAAAAMAALALSACGTGTPPPSTGPPPPSTGTQPVPVQTNSQALPQPATASTVGATINYKGNEGDSETQTLSFGSPVTESSVPAVSSAAQNCSLGTEDTPPNDNLVVPVTIVTTLNSDLPVNFAINLQSNPQGDALLEQIFVYETTSGYTCVNEGDGQGTQEELSLTPAAPDTLNAWVVLLGAITPSYPDGNPAQLGDSGIGLQINNGFSASELISGTMSGPRVCTGDDVVYPPYFLIGGTAPSGLTCNTTYSYSGG